MSNIAGFALAEKLAKSLLFVPGLAGRHQVSGEVGSADRPAVGDGPDFRQRSVDAPLSQPLGDGLGAALAHFTLGPHRGRHGFAVQCDIQAHHVNRLTAPLAGQFHAADDGRRIAGHR